MAQSNRGGYRPGSGRPRLWQSKQTKTIAVPAILVPRLLELAKILDEGGEVIEIRRFDTTVLPRPDRLSWNIYKRVEKYNQRTRKNYWGDWEWAKACQSEKEADGWISLYKKWNMEHNRRTDGPLIHEQYEKRLERISPATVPQPRPDDAVLGGQGDRPNQVDP